MSWRARNHPYHAPPPHPRHRVPPAGGLGAVLAAEAPVPPAADARSLRDGAARRRATRQRLRQTRRRRTSAGRRRWACVAAAGTFAQPVYVTAPPGDTRRLFVVEKAGRIRDRSDGSAGDALPRHLGASVSAGGEQGLLSLAFDPRLRHQRPLLRQLHRPQRRHPRSCATGSRREPRRRRRRSTRGSCCASTSRTRNHNGGQLQFGPDGLPLRRHGRRRQRRTTRATAAEPRSRSRQDAAPRRRRLAESREQPTPTACATRGASPSTARPAPCGSATSARTSWEEIDYLPAGRPPGSQLRLERLRGHARLQCAACDAARDSLVAGREYSHSARHSVTGGYVYRGSAIPGLRGWYLFADDGSGPRVGDEGPGARGSHALRAPTAGDRDHVVRQDATRRALHRVARRRRLPDVPQRAAGRRLDLAPAPLQEPARVAVRRPLAWGSS